MSERQGFDSDEMNVFELIFLAAAVLIGFVVGRYLFLYIGWWSVFPAVVVGAGTMVLIVTLIRRFGGGPSVKT